MFFFTNWKFIGKYNDAKQFWWKDGGFAPSRVFNYTNPGYGLSLVDTLWNAGSYRQPLEQEGNPMT